MSWLARKSKSDGKEVRVVAAVAGLSLVGLGLLGLYDAFQTRDDRIAPEALQLQFFAPILFGVGAILCAIALRTGEGRWPGAGALVLGLAMLAVGICPWGYTPFLTGDRPGGEGAGMFGTMIFIFIGLPGIAVALIGFVLLLLNVVSRRMAEEGTLRSSKE